MDRDCSAEILIDLGSATAETRGGLWGSMDFEGTLKPLPGLTDD